MHGNSQNTVTTSSPQNQPRAPQPYYVQHEFEGPSKLTTTLVHALSDVTGADVTEAESTLANYVDPDALNHLFKPGSDGIQQPNGHLSFNVWGRQVTVYHSGQIVISPPSQSPTA